MVVPQKVKDLLNDQIIPLLGIILMELKSGTEIGHYSYTYCTIIHNSQDNLAWMDKWMKKM